MEATRIVDYRGHRLVARQEPRGWRVVIDGGVQTGLHSETAGAIAEASRYVDA